MAVSFGSFLKKRQPAKEFIQTLEKTKNMMLIPFSVFEYMQREHTSILQTNFDVLVDYSEWLEQGLFSSPIVQRRTSNAQPELILKIPLMYIASYLGITLTNLVYSLSICLTYVK